MKRIHKVKTAVIVKDSIPDEKIEILRDNCNNLRDRAMIDFLLSTGIRVGKLVRMNIDDIDFSERECVVYGKGDKERKAYFDAKTKIHLLNYIESRTDNNIALFVSLNQPHSRPREYRSSPPLQWSSFLRNHVSLPAGYTLRSAAFLQKVCNCILR